ncbi:hypothetical protein BDV97DRAFT_399470 [Delphinella strobiligena]|nr:hypothetical protein BDV97DRAFT_399470 [Delphinella strobiligena]
MSPNYALLSIPVYSFLAMTPHMYSASLLASTKQGINNKNPHGSDHIAAAAHRNNLENAPLFFATILAAVFAEKTTGSDLGSAAYAATFLVLRVVYNFLYVTTETESLSHARSMTFTAGTFLSFWQIWKSAAALG